MTNKTITGSCLCGTVKYQFSGPVLVFQYCHCSRCQKVTGSAHAANLIIKPEQFQWMQGEESAGRYEVAGAKHFATSFCKKCGSNLPWLTKSGKAVVVPAGSLDDDPQARPSQNIFYADRANWYISIDELVKHNQQPG
jgi:hypothetical protein